MDQASAVSVRSVRHQFLDPNEHRFRRADDEQGAGDHQSPFGLVVGVFLIGYFILEIPSNLTLHRVRRPCLDCRILITWGLVAIAMGFVRNVGQLYVARLGARVPADSFPHRAPRIGFHSASGVLTPRNPSPSNSGGPNFASIRPRALARASSCAGGRGGLEGLPAVLAGALTDFEPRRTRGRGFLSAQLKRTRSPKNWEAIDERRGKRAPRFGARRAAHASCAPIGDHRDDARDRCVHPATSPAASGGESGRVLVVSGAATLP